jgi:beta-glucosidase
MLNDEEALKVARETLSKMTLEEKVQLLGGSGTFTLSAIPRVGIQREWLMSDNSSTIRPAFIRWTWGYVEPRSKNTKLPSLSALAQTWDPRWARKHGEVLGAEARDRGVDQLLGPGVNILRTPLNGRNWEYLGEDPILASRMCVPMIQGVQSYDVAATVKHFCLNDQELNRDTVDTHVDDRTLNEIYLPAFRAAIKEAGVLCVMSSYNKIDGIWASENKYTQKAILRDRWGFQGILVTDWGGQHTTAFAANNGGGLEMQYGEGIIYNYNPKAGTYPLADAVRANEVPAATVDEMALRTLWVMAKTGFLTDAPRKAGSSNTKAHQRIAREEGAASVVLLKNSKGVLPLNAKKLKKVLVIGKLADEKQCHQGCSGEGCVPYEVTLFGALKERLKGCEVVLMPFCAKREIAQTDTSNATLTGGHVKQKTSADWCDAKDLKKAAESADAVIIFTGTELGYQENMESESRDRESMDWPKELQDAMHTILGWKLKNLVVISRSGTPVGYTWTDKVETMLQTSYLGMEEGNALVDVVFGDVNPSGKLAQTWPRSYDDTAVAQMGTYNGEKIVYNERFYVGYRWHDHKGIAPLFPFGHGLSYTTFGYSKVAATSARGRITVSLTLKNTGKVPGAEVVQVYASYPNAKVERCVKELKGFQKVLLKPGESRKVVIPIRTRDLAYWDEFHHQLRVDAGKVEFLVGSSSADIRGKARITITHDSVYND